MGDIIGIGLEHFRTRADALRFERAAARGLAEDAYEVKDCLRDRMSDVVCALEAMVGYCRVEKRSVAEALAILMDAVSDADHSCNRDIDAASEHFDPIDLSEARALLTELTP